MTLNRYEFSTPTPFGDIDKIRMLIAKTAMIKKKNNTEAYAKVSNKSPFDFITTTEIINNPTKKNIPEVDIINLK